MVHQDWWDGWALAVITAIVLYWVLRWEHHAGGSDDGGSGRREEGLDFWGNQAPRRIAQRPWGRHGGEDSGGQAVGGGGREVWEKDGGESQIRQGTPRVPQRPVGFPSTHEEWGEYINPKEPTFDDDPRVHMYSPDIQRDGRCCVVCGRLPGGLWHFKAVE